VYEPYHLRKNDRLYYVPDFLVILDYGQFILEVKPRNPGYREISKAITAANTFKIPCVIAYGTFGKRERKPRFMVVYPRSEGRDVIRVKFHEFIHTFLPTGMNIDKLLSQVRKYYFHVFQSNGRVPGKWHHNPQGLPRGSAYPGNGKGRLRPKPHRRQS
jgi:hypothetical protein